MQIWIKKKGNWVIIDANPFPGKLPLLSAVNEQLQKCGKNPKSPEMLVFSPEEERMLADDAAKYIDRDGLIAFKWLECVINITLRGLTKNPPKVKYISGIPGATELETGTMRLAIGFNMKL